MQTVTRAWLGLGANLGDPIQQLIDARVKLVNLPFVSAWQCSSMYVSSPVGYSDQADFINCVLALDVSVSAQDLFAQMQLIEVALGRVRVQDNQNAPRCIDIDLLMYGEQAINESNLVVPHPRMNQRLFVIEPLQQLGVRVEADQDIDFSDQHLHKLSI